MGPEIPSRKAISEDSGSNANVLQMRDTFNLELPINTIVQGNIWERIRHCKEHRRGKGEERSKGIYCA